MPWQLIVIVSFRRPGVISLAWYWMRFMEAQRVSMISPCVRAQLIKKSNEWLSWHVALWPERCSLFTTFNTSGGTWSLQIIPSKSRVIKLTLYLQLMSYVSTSRASKAACLYRLAVTTSTSAYLQEIQKRGHKQAVQGVRHTFQSFEDRSFQKGTKGHVVHNMTLKPLEPADF